MLIEASESPCHTDLEWRKKGCFILSVANCLLSWTASARSVKGLTTVSVQHGAMYPAEGIVQGRILIEKAYFPNMKQSGWEDPDSCN